MISEDLYTVRSHCGTPRAERRHTSKCKTTMSEEGVLSTFHFPRTFHSQPSMALSIPRPVPPTQRIMRHAFVHRKRLRAAGRLVINFLTRDRTTRDRLGVRRLSQRNAGDGLTVPLHIWRDINGSHACPIKDESYYC